MVAPVRALGKRWETSYSYRSDALAFSSRDTSLDGFTTAVKYSDAPALRIGEDVVVRSTSGGVVRQRSVEENIYPIECEASEASLKEA
ncbi:hypothetical protein Y032_0274g1008 [Ancylostoma ceylanicum]|uniref:Uncharacterized protein n=1 Tax=Ancylostoma ceylanicum TaxID=53326 RepID=A0A016S7Q4_9BILA|nr:hypothetical protein Y032_0274g1008 [Ancylostoma ceylanicum]